MDTKDFEEYLAKRYYDQLYYYERVSGTNKKKYQNFQWFLIILSTLTTVLAALPPINNFDLKYVVVAVAGLVAILTTALKTFQYGEIWVNYRSTIEQLKPEIYYYKFNVGDYGKEGVNKESLFVTRVEKVLNKERDHWSGSKKLQEQNIQQIIEELQNKLDQLLKTNIKTPVLNQPATTVIEQQDELVEKPDEEPGKDTNDKTPGPEK
jgi:hypothetical protein